MTLAVVYTGNEPYIRLVITAPATTPNVASTAVTFTRYNPDGTTVTASSPAAGITGPTAGTTVIDGVTRTTTTWTWHPPIFMQPGRSTIRARSTSGLLCSDNLDIVTPSYAPFPTP